MNPARNSLTYGILLAIWGLIIVWQCLEHQRVTMSARQALIHRALDISNAVGVVIHSQRRFGGIVTQDRLESALNDLVRSDDLTGVTLFNAQGEVVAAAGEAPPNDQAKLNVEGETWSTDSVTVVNNIYLGQITPDDGEPSSPTIVLSNSEVQERFRQRRSRSPQESTPAIDPPSEPTFPATKVTRRSRYDRHRLMDSERYQELLKSQSLHRFALVLPTHSVQTITKKDRWFRFTVILLALLALVASMLARESLLRSSYLQLRLVRAKELNDYLQEMNLAAAGLAHETRNPLNLIRGLAQMISKTPGLAENVSERSQQITLEVDRVTDQLNDFITYSKPRETRLAPVNLNESIRDVMRTLSPDLEDKSIHWQVSGPNLSIEADEKMLRQVLFNLLLNATQALGQNGTIQIRSNRDDNEHASLYLEDNGPGIPNDIVGDVFKPYFTSHDGGTGLGLSIVQQIALAHDWDIHYESALSGGAIFRLSRLHLSSSNRP